jgi:hypothetical protein
MGKGIFESTNITGRNYFFVSTVDLENGMLVHKGGLIPGSKDVYEALIPTAGTISAEPVYAVGNPAWSYDSSSIVNQNEDNYIIKAGTVFRVYGLKPTDKFGIADYGIDGTPVVGQFVGLQAGSGKPVAAASAPSTAFVGKVIQEVDMGYEYFVGQIVDNRTKKIRIEVVKNG